MGNRKITSLAALVTSHQWPAPKNHVTIATMATGIGKQVGSRIKALREAQGLTQAQLAKLLGKSVETISNFERGKVITSLLTLEQIARHLNVAVRDFFADDAVPQRSRQLSKPAITALNAVRLLSEDDLEIVAGLIEVLQRRQNARRRHK